MPVFCGTELRFCRLCNFDLPNKQRFSLQRHKSTRIRLVPNSWIVCFELWHRALGAKACHPDQRFCRWKLLFYQQPCAKAKEFGEAEFWDSMPVFYGGILYWLLEKQGKLYFLQSSQTSRERGNQRFRCVGFLSPLDPHPFLTPTRGVPLDPLCYVSLFGTGICIRIQRKLNSGALAWGFWEVKAL